jgi:hypothetical protein
VPEHTGRPVHVALEFLSYIYQPQTDAYTQGKMSEVDFKKEVEFGDDFLWYKDKILFSGSTGGRTLSDQCASRSHSNHFSRGP